MIGVQFTKSVAPYSKGDRAMLPEDLAQKIIDGGEGELVEMPAHPHAQQFGEKDEVPSQKPATKAKPSPAKSRMPARNEKPLI